MTPSRPSYRNKTCPWKHFKSIFVPYFIPVEDTLELGCWLNSAADETASQHYGIVTLLHFTLYRKCFFTEFYYVSKIVFVLVQRNSIGNRYGTRFVISNIKMFLKNVSSVFYRTFIRSCSFRPGPDLDTWSLPAPSIALLYCAFHANFLGNCAFVPDSSHESIK